MKHFFLLLFLFSCLCLSAQHRNSDGFLSGTFQVDAPEHYDPVVSARLSGGVKLKNIALAGIGIGVTKFEEFKKVYIPVFGSLTVGDFSKKVTPLAVVEPGYGIYKENIRIGSRRTTREGGFTFFGGVGVGIAAKRNANLSFSVGYSHYTFSIDNHSSAVKGVGLRFTATAL